MSTRSLVIGTAGHIDHGKSALVKALTGTDPDRLKEERERGITIDLGFAHLEVGDVQLAFVDVPGHERFVRTMLAGAGGIDAVMLVVAADESVMPQTREHFDLCRLLGVERGVIALAKSDLVDRDVAELVALEVRELAADSFLAGAEIVPVSARTGTGLEALKHALVELAGAPPRQARAGVVRVPIDRVFTVKGFGTVVTGTLVSGRVREGDELAALPDGRAVRVRGLQTHGRKVAEAEAARRLALNLGGVEAGDLHRGVTLCTPGAFAVTRRVDACVSLLRGTRPLRHGARVRVHHGTADVLARAAVAAIRAGDEWRRVEAGDRGVAIPAGAQAFVRLRCERPLVLTRGDRVVLRACSPAATIGGGVVLDPEPPKGGVRRAAAFERFRNLLIETPHEARDAETPRFVERWVTEAGLAGMAIVDLVRRGGLDPRTAERVCAGLAASGRARQVGGRLFDAAAVDGAREGLVAALARFHREQPASEGMPREALRQAATPGAPVELFDAIVEELAAAAKVRGTDALSLASRSGAVNPEVANARDLIDAQLRSAGLTPPDLSSMRAAARLTPAAFDHAVRLLVREQRAVRAGGLLFHSAALERLRDDLRSLKAAGQPETTIDVATFKARYGLTRKFAIPLLEWLDRERITRRIGEKRIVL